MKIWLVVAIYIAYRIYVWIGGILGGSGGGGASSGTLFVGGLMTVCIVCYLHLACRRFRLTIAADAGGCLCTSFDMISGHVVKNPSLIAVYSVDSVDCLVVRAGTLSVGILSC